MTKTFHLACAYIIICVVAAFTSCTSHPVDAVLDEADALFADYPDSAYALLKGIDAASLPSGSERQARYALLYTKCQYKTYDDAPTDSLISLAADYYEEHGSEEEKFYAYLFQGLVRYLLGDMPKASTSFLRAVANGEEVIDHYAKGQLYSYMGQINSMSHCSEEEEYAYKAYQEYLQLGQERYILNSLLNLSVAKKHQYDYASCFKYIDSCLLLASSSGDEEMFAKSIAIKADCAILADSLELSMSLYRNLLCYEAYSPTEIDYSNIAYLFAERQQSDSARLYLSFANTLMMSEDDWSNYWVKSLWVNQSLNDLDKTIECQDSLLCIQERLLSEAMSHAIIAEQREYSERQLERSEFRLRHTRNILFFSLLCILLFVLLFIEREKKDKAFRKAKMAEIKVLQMDLQLHSKERNEALQTIMSNSFVQDLKLSTNRTQGLIVTEWKQLEALFTEHLPQFETALRKITKLSETEWHICMLLKLSFPPGDIAFLLNKTPGAISSARLRMYQRVFHRKGHTSEWDEFIKRL